MWKRKFQGDGWSPRAIAQYKLCLAESTLQAYNRQLCRFQEFCVSRDCEFPPVGPGNAAILADFLCAVADRCDRPESQLKCTMAAIGHLYAAIHVSNPISVELVNLSTALVKSGTNKPVTRTKVMPSESFEKLFLSWPENEELQVNKLRQKAVTLCALVCMTRPSDLAPLAKMFNVDTQEATPVLFTTDRLEFHEDGSMTVSFFGIKNDTDRKGFEVRIPPHSNAKLDPVRTIQTYIDKTSHQRLPGGPVFIGLKRPYAALRSGSISEILKRSIKDAGLQDQGFTARSFRPTGATAAVRSEVDPGTVRQIGRWKSEKVFYEHYVYPNAPDKYCDKVVSYKGISN